MKKDDYLEKFAGDSVKDETRQAKALERAHKIREFEISLSWKRTAYFVLFISATATAYGLLLGIDKDSMLSETTRHMFLLLVACLGMIFSFGWFLVNKGSKYWQENWEYHIDFLEDDVTGPLHKTVLEKNPSGRGGIKNFITGPGSFSVSKTNQIISFVVFVFWVGISIYSLGKAVGCSWQKIFSSLGFPVPLAAVLIFFVSMGGIIWLLYATRSQHQNSKKQKCSWWRCWRCCRKTQTGVTPIHRPTKFDDE